MTRIEFQKLLARFRSEKCRPDERELIEQWMEAIQSQEIHGLDYTKKESALRSQILQSIRPAGEFLKEKVVSTGPHGARYWAAAAILLLSCGLYFIKVTWDNKSPNTQKITAVGNQKADSVQNNGVSRKAIKLSDGSIVRLEQGGKIVIAPDFKTGKERKIQLQGTAFFRLAHDAGRPFIVTTRHLVTKVPGTSFTISAEKGKEERVKTGKVAIRCQAEKDQQPHSFVAVSANYRIRYDSASRKLIESIVEHPSLVRGSLPNSLFFEDRPKLKFEEVSAAEILKALQEAYGIKIRFDESRLSKCMITASMKTDDFYFRLQTVCDLIGGHYKQQGNEIEVTGQGCS